MKLNLPSTWTSEKITSLIFLTWLSANQVKAGQAFKNCLAYERKDTTTYALLLKYPFESQTNITNGDSLRLCCDSFQCSTSLSLACIKNNFFGCAKVSQGVYCGCVYSSCAGVVGDTLVTTNTTLGNSYNHNTSLSLVANYLASVPVSNFTGLKHGYANYDCKSELCLNSACTWDNGGWRCSKGYLFPSGNSSNDRGFLIQWTAPWPGSVDKNPLLSITSSSSQVATANPTTFSIITPKSTPGGPPPILPSYSDLPLAEKIAIPIGTAVGVGVGSGLGYCLWKKRNRKRKRKQELVNIATDTQTEEIKKPELPTGISHEDSNDQAVESSQRPVELLTFRNPETNVVQTDSSTSNTQPQIAQQVINPNQPRQINFSITVPTWLNRVFA